MSEVKGEKTVKASCDVEEIFRFMTDVLNDFFRKENLQYRAKFLVASHVEFPYTSNIGVVAKQKEKSNEILKHLIVFKPPFVYGIGIYRIVDNRWHLHTARGVEE